MTNVTWIIGRVLILLRYVVSLTRVLLQEQSKHTVEFHQPECVRERPLRNQIENTDLQVFYQPEGVSLRFYPQPEANAFRLIQPNRCNNYYLLNLLSGTLSLAPRFSIQGPEVNAFQLIKQTLARAYFVFGAVVVQ